MRILITGMGGELGTRVAGLLEADESIEAIAGMDIDPPRRRLHRADFFRVDPRHGARVGEVIAAFAPTAIVHIGTYEPYARSSPKAAIERTAAGSVAVMRAAVEVGTVDRIVVRSGIEIYGRRPGSSPRPHDDDVVDPSTPWGHSLRHAERVARDAGRQIGAPVTQLRFAPLVGPHFPSPLGRLLRQPVVPVAVRRDPPFSVLHQEDAAAALCAAVRRPYDGPVNVVGAGSITASRAALIGRRVPLPILGPAWRPARVLAEFTGAPIPAHIYELLTQGRTADGSNASTRIGVAPTRRTVDVIEALYAWAEVTYLQPVPSAA